MKHLFVGLSVVASIAIGFSLGSSSATADDDVISPGTPAETAVTALSPAARSTKHCVSVRYIRGDACGKANSLRLQATNNCGKMVWWKGCIKKAKGTWNCGVHSQFPAGAMDNGIYVCNAATGPNNVRWTSCTGGRNECGFKP
jgi:hypothetical protein